MLPVLTAILFLSPYALTEIPQVISQAEAHRLSAAGITTTDDLLARGSTEPARRALAKTAQVSPAEIERYVDMCDLVRIRGVGPEMVRLFRAAGVKTSRQLGEQDASKFWKRLISVNDKQKITPNPPEEKSVAAWIESAKQLPRVRE